MSTETSRTPNMNLMLHSNASGSEVTFDQWRMDYSGDVYSNMMIIDEWSGSLISGWAPVSPEDGISISEYENTLSVDNTLDTYRKYSTGLKVKLDNPDTKYFYISSIFVDPLKRYLVLDGQGIYSLSADPLTNVFVSRELSPIGFPFEPYSEVIKDVSGTATSGSSYDFSRADHGHTLGEHTHTSLTSGSRISHYYFNGASSFAPHYRLDNLHGSLSVTPPSSGSGTPLADGSGYLDYRWFANKFRKTIFSPSDVENISRVFTLMKTTYPIVIRGIEIIVSNNTGTITIDLNKSDSLILEGFSADEILNGIVIQNGGYANSSFVSDEIEANKYINIFFYPPSSSDIDYMTVTFYYTYPH